MFVASSRAGTALGGVGMRDPRELIPELCMLGRPLRGAGVVPVPVQSRYLLKLPFSGIIYVTPITYENLKRLSIS